MRVLLVLAAVVLSLAIVHSQPCLKTHWANDEARYGKMCYSDIPYLYSDRGLVEGRWPYSDPHRRYQVMEYPVGISYFAWVAAKATQATSLTRAGPPVSERRADAVVDGLRAARASSRRSTPTSCSRPCCWRRACWAPPGSSRRPTGDGRGTHCRSCSPRCCWPPPW